MKNLKKYSIIISVYKNDNPKHFQEALDSLMNQTIKPDEIIITQDGFISLDLKKIIDRAHAQPDITINLVKSKVNKGLGIMREKGVSACNNELIGVMDADDICVNDRFEKQLAIFEKIPNIDLVGGFISEFEGENKHLITGQRFVPKNHDKILKFSKWRDGVNHVTVMFKKSSVMAAGNYQDWLWFEDSWLWSRMLINGSKFYNIQETLVFVRVGLDMLTRRRGVRYIKSETTLMWHLYRIGFLNLFEFIGNVSIRIPIRILPRQVIGLAFKYILRN